MIWSCWAGQGLNRALSRPFVLMNKERIAQLEREIAEMKARIPKHSVRPHHMIRLEELEEELARLKQEEASAQS